MSFIFSIPPEFLDALFGLPPHVAQYVQQKRLDRTQICTNCQLLETIAVGELICRADIRERYMPDVRDVRTHCLTPTGYRVRPLFAERRLSLS
ncbi:hypothetical protein EXS73_02895 [Candidatus Pacearchaeota archaeon]|nr:hypothetical protein [Candidatus Pacearchaeota archaeon]